MAVQNVVTSLSKIRNHVMIPRNRAGVKPTTIEPMPISAQGAAGPFLKVDGGRKTSAKVSLKLIMPVLIVLIANSRKTGKVGGIQRNGHWRIQRKSEAHYIEALSAFNRHCSSATRSRGMGDVRGEGGHQGGVVCGVLDVEGSVRRGSAHR